MDVLDGQPAFAHPLRLLRWLSSYRHSVRSTWLRRATPSTPTLHHCQWSRFSGPGFPTIALTGALNRVSTPLARFITNRVHPSPGTEPMNPGSGPHNGSGAALLWRPRWLPRSWHPVQLVRDRACSLVSRPVKLSLAFMMRRPEPLSRAHPLPFPQWLLISFLISPAPSVDVAVGAPRNGAALSDSRAWPAFLPGLPPQNDTGGAETTRQDSAWEEKKFGFRRRTHAASPAATFPLLYQGQEYCLSSSAGDTIGAALDFSAACLRCPRDRKDLGSVVRPGPALSRRHIADYGSPS
ncbi:hypothetical protein PWT90_05655 [Aphanocladium album]|nr:hypothetical protein PWT90_05655 [Aphanocladium album]